MCNLLQYWEQNEAQKLCQNQDGSGHKNEMQIS